MDIHCSNVGVKAGTENCNYCIIRKSCGALKEAKRLNKNKGDKNMQFTFSNNPIDRLSCWLHNKKEDETGKLFNKKIPKFNDIKLFTLSSTTVMSGANSFDWKTKRIYEDDDFIIDLVAAGTPTLRVSVFKDNHFQDEVFIRKDDYIG